MAAEAEETREYGDGYRRHRQTMLVVSLPKGDEGKALKNELELIAKEEDRSLSNLIFTILKGHLRNLEKPG